MVKKQQFDQQFDGHVFDDLKDHMEKCFRLTYTVKSKGVPHDVIKPSLFQFSLKEEAEVWYESRTQGSIET